MKLSWNRITDSVRYEVQVDDSSVFTLPLTHSAIVNGLSTTIPSLANGTYYWRVRGLRGDGTFSGWSSVERFDLQH